MATSDSASDVHAHANGCAMPPSDTVHVLLGEAGLSPGAADLAGVSALRARFAADRQRLAVIDLDDAEPLTVVVPPRTEGA
jgi:hypothetical protein